MKGELISMTRAWEKEKKSESPTGIKPMTCRPNTGWTLYPLSYENSWGAQVI